MEFKIFLSTSTPKIPSGIFSELELILQADLGRTDMVTLLHLLTNERGISLCLFKSFDFSTVVLGYVA